MVSVRKKRYVSVPESNRFVTALISEFRLPLLVVVVGFVQHFQEERGRLKPFHLQEAAVLFAQKR